MTIIGIQLAWIVVKDLDQAIQYYTEVLGFVLKEHVKEFGWAELQGQSGARLGLALEQKENPIKAGSNGVITITVDNMENMLKECSKKRVKLIGDVMEIPGEVKLQTIQDPDGNTFQLAEILRK